MLSKISSKVAKWLGEEECFGVKQADSDVLKKAHDFLKYHSLSDLLIYEAYDAEYGVYMNRRSLGFVLEVGLFIGSDNRLENELGGLFKNILPPGSNIQFMLTALPKVGNALEEWQHRRAGHNELLAALAKQRVDFFANLTSSGTKPFRIRDLRCIVSFSVPSRQKGRLERAEISELKTRVKALFETRNIGVADIAPEEFISKLSDILNYDGSIEQSKLPWNEYQEIKEQIIEGNRHYELRKDALCSGGYEYRMYSVKRYPQAWYFSGMGNLLGDNLNDFLKIPCAFIMHYGIHITDSGFKKTAMMAKASRTESQAASPLGKWIPALRREAEEWHFVREQLEKDERIVRSNFQVMLIDESSNIAASEQILHTLYRSNGWEIMQDRFIVLPSFLSVLPMFWGDGMESDLSYFKKLRTTLSHEPVNLLPLQGESKGTYTPGMLLAGRRGQIQYWYPFDEGAGNSNYNVTVVGRSGSGKSVFMQELTTSILSLKGKAYVLDVGRSFEKQVKLFEGQFIEFSTTSELCLNPFSNIDDRDEESIQDSLSVLKPIIAMMAAPKAGTSDYEDSLIGKALAEVWKEFGKQAGMGEVARWFLRQEDEKDRRLGVMLFPYTEEGAYGRFFNGVANIDFSANFFVVELEELKSRPELQSVVVQILMLLITNDVILGGRKYHSALIFDEAWDLLRGKQGGQFIERLARTLRKYKGALVVGTQTLDDFYSSPGAEAAFMNSDWLCMLSQKKESIALLKKSGKFVVDDHMQRLLESVKSVPGEYAEIMIMASGSSGSISRLLLDPFSLVLYSTKAEEYSRVKDLQGQGLALGDAIAQVAKERYGG
jgi:conjugal transfer ATP-binding protein TraC